MKDIALHSELISRSPGSLRASCSRTSRPIVVKICVRIRSYIMGQALRSQMSKSWKLSGDVGARTLPFVLTSGLRRLPITDTRLAFLYLNLATLIQVHAESYQKRPAVYSAHDKRERRCIIYKRAPHPARKQRRTSIARRGGRCTYIVS